MSLSGEEASCSFERKASGLARDCPAMVFLLTSMTSGQARPLAQDGSTGQHALKTHFGTENTVDNIVGTLYGTDLIG